MIERPAKFSKRGGLYRILAFTGAVLGKGGWIFQGGWGGGCSFYITNELKSEIFNEKKSL